MKTSKNLPAKRADLQLVAANGKFIFCDSRMVAEKFEVKHNRVMRAIERNMDKYSAIQGTQRVPSDLIFDPVFIKFEDSYQGQNFTAYRMNRDAFMIIAVRFETDQAIKWQRKFFTAFKVMEAELAGQTIPIPGEKTKRCTTCKQTKPVSSFWKNVCTHDGLQSQCKDCVKSYSAGYRLRNRIKNTGIALPDAEINLHQETASA
jgi:Rha family phage regulatory protein